MGLKEEHLIAFLICLEINTDVTVVKNCEPIYVLLAVVLKIATGW